MIQSREGLLVHGNCRVSLWQPYRVMLRHLVVLQYATCTLVAGKDSLSLWPPLLASTQLSLARNHMSIGMSCSGIPESKSKGGGMVSLP